MPYGTTGQSVLANYGRAQPQTQANKAGRPMAPQAPPAPGTQTANAVGQGYRIPASGMQATMATARGPWYGHPAKPGGNGVDPHSRFGTSKPHGGIPGWVNTGGGMVSNPGMVMGPPPLPRPVIGWGQDRAFNSWGSDYGTRNTPGLVAAPMMSTDTYTPTGTWARTATFNSNYGQNNGSAPVSSDGGQSLLRDGKDIPGQNTGGQGTDWSSSGGGRESMSKSLATGGGTQGGASTRSYSGGGYTAKLTQSGSQKQNLARTIFEEIFGSAATPNNTDGRFGVGGGIGLGFTDLLNSLLRSLTGGVGGALGSISQTMSSDDIRDATSGERGRIYERYDDIANAGMGLMSPEARRTAEDAARADLYYGINSQRDAALRNQAAMSSRGGAASSGSNIGVYNAATQAAQAGERGLAQDAFERLLAATQAGAGIMSDATGSQLGYLMDNATTRKEVMAMLLEALSAESGVAGDVLSGPFG